MPFASLVVGPRFTIRMWWVQGGHCQANHTEIESGSGRGRRNEQRTPRARLQRRQLLRMRIGDLHSGVLLRRVIEAAQLPMALQMRSPLDVRLPERDVRQRVQVLRAKRRRLRQVLDVIPTQSR